MYDELIKRLRTSCESCKLWDGYKCCLKGECSAHTRLEAADAIEDLSAAVEGYESSTNMALVEKDGETVIEFQPKWIPVTERLPSHEGKYITAFSKGGVGENVFMIFTDASAKWYYNSEDTGEVTHWMPLPEPPKEE